MLFCNSKSKVRQNVNRHDCVVRSEGDFFRSRSEGRYVVWLLVSCSRSLFSGIVTRCANTGFLRITIPRIPAFVDACVRAYVSITSISPAWTASIGSDRFSRSSLSISPALCTRLKSFQCPTSIRHNYPPRSNSAKSAYTSH